MTAADETIVQAQLGRSPRGVVGIAHRCPCGRPDVLTTRPRLPGGEPFPTTFYLSCPRASAACSGWESRGTMTRLSRRLDTEPELAAAYRSAHQAYVAARHAVGQATGDGDVPELDGVSAGGMPRRVKCLHALAAHALAVGPGVNPLGDQTLELIGRYWDRPCLSEEPVAPLPAATEPR